MATSRSFAEFNKRIRVVAEGTTRNVEKTVRKAALAADQVVVTMTPVDTGRARAAWLVTVGVPSEGLGFFQGPKGERDSNEGPATDTALQQAGPVIDGYTLDKGSIFITNNLPYIGRLDEGYSQQAPTGMTAAAVQVASNIIRKAKVTDGL